MNAAPKSGSQKLQDLYKAGEGLIEMMEVKDSEEQEKMRETGERLARRLLTLIDEAIESAQIIPQLESVNMRIRN